MCSYVLHLSLQFKMQHSNKLPTTRSACWHSCNICMHAPLVRTRRHASMRKFGEAERVCASLYGQELLHAFVGPFVRCECQVPGGELFGLLLLD
jgi:hypothetical protein